MPLPPEPPLPADAPIGTRSASATTIPLTTELPPLRPQVVLPREPPFGPLPQSVLALTPWPYLS